MKLRGEYRQVAAETGYNIMLPRDNAYSDDEQWAPVSDLMAVIMLVFMLIAMILLTHFDLEKRSNGEKCDHTRSMLNSEFKDDFKDWKVELDEDLTIRFTNQEVLFPVAKTIPTDWFVQRIRNFFPRYMEVIKNIGAEFGKDEIVAIRIEGHTSSEYGDKDTSVDNAYVKNMELSQGRAREIIKMVLDLPQAENYSDIVRSQVRADGLSSGKLICGENGEDKNSSRRVEFKLLTKSCQKAGVYDKSKPLTNSCPNTGEHNESA
ncbi:MAG: hypothetical protein ACR2P5_06750 [Gammaproteobacteria bacterium]